MIKEEDVKKSIILLLDDLRTFIEGGKSLYDWSDFLNKDCDFSYDGIGLG